MEPSKGDGGEKKLPPKKIPALGDTQKIETIDLPTIETMDLKQSTAEEIKEDKNRDEGVIDETKLSNLILNVKHMAIFAAEKGILPNDIKLGEIYNIWNTKQEQGIIGKEEINLISFYYRKLEQILGDVTAFSLMATKCNNIDDCMKSDAGRYVKKQIFMVFGLLSVIVVTYVYGYYYENLSTFRFQGPHLEFTSSMVIMDLLYRFGQYLIPFTYGTLGAMAFILRYSVGRLHKREFDPRRIPGNYIRIVLGTICGGAIVMFVDTNSTFGVDVTAAALGFLAGYSTDFLFGIVDRLKDSIEPGENKKGQVSPRSELEAKDILQAEPLPEELTESKDTSKAKPAVAH